jgi:NAD-dependent deacetylase
VRRREAQLLRFPVPISRFPFASRFPFPRSPLQFSRIVILTGAGISADSGVPTFRGGDGLWKSYRVEELATPEAFARDPRTVWEWYAWRRQQIAACVPNAAHLACARLALRRPGVTIVTQNVDGLHAAAARAAAASGDPGPAMPIELHGSLFCDRCAQCGAPREPADDLTIDASSETTLPRCRCGGLHRPGVVWFGETLPVEALEAAYRAARDADVCVVIGTSAVVYPAAGIAVAALERGATLIEVNPEETPFTAHAALSLRGRAADLVPELLEGA